MDPSSPSTPQDAAEPGGGSRSARATPPVFPASVEDLDAATIEAVLRERRPQVRVAGLSVVGSTRDSAGIASTADRVVVDLRYADGHGVGLPGRMVLKTMLASPRAPAVMFENEVRFYREVRDDLSIEAPLAFGTGFDPASGRFGVLLEDLTLRGARFPVATSPVTVDEVRSLLGHLATLHAAYWEHPRLDSDLSWLATPAAGGMSDVFAEIGLSLIEDQVRRHSFKADFIGPLGRSVPEMWELLWRVQREHSEAPTTILHGDPHIANTYLLPDGTGGLLDWQLMVRGRWAHDVTYLIVTGLEPEVRRSVERELLSEYRDRLATLGVARPPSIDDVFTEYRRAALWGLVIGWLITPPANYGEAITAENIRRTVAAVDDLGTFEAIEDLPRGQL